MGRWDTSPVQPEAVIRFIERPRASESIDDYQSARGLQLSFLGDLPPLNLI